MSRLNIDIPVKQYRQIKEDRAKVNEVNNYQGNKWFCNRTLELYDDYLSSILVEFISNDRSTADSDYDLMDTCIYEELSGEVMAELYQSNLVVALEQVESFARFKFDDSFTVENELSIERDEIDYEILSHFACMVMMAYLPSSEDFVKLAHDIFEELQCEIHNLCGENSRMCSLEVKRGIVILEFEEL